MNSFKHLTIVLFSFFFRKNFFCVNIITYAEKRHVDSLCETE